MTLREYMTVCAATAGSAMMGEYTYEYHPPEVPDCGDDTACAKCGRIVHPTDPVFERRMKTGWSRREYVCPKCIAEVLNHD